MTAPASTKQALTTVTLWDYEYDVTGAALVKAQIEVSLTYDQATVSTPAVILEAVKKTTTTDSNGQWSVDVVSNNAITPSGTTYLVKTPMRTFQVQLPSGAGPFQASAYILSGGVLGSLSGFTTGSIPYVGSGGGWAQDNANLFWNSTNHRLGVGTTAPSYPVHIRGSQNGAVLGIDSVTPGDQTTLRSLDAGNPLWDIYKFGVGGQLTFYDATNGRQVLSLFPETAIGTMQIRDGWHIVISGPNPTLGALQPGISAQSVVAGSTDTRGRISVTTTGAPPGPGAVIAVVQFAMNYAASPFVAVGSSSGQVGQFGAYNIGVGGFTIYNAGNSALAGIITFTIDYIVIG